MVMLKVSSLCAEMVNDVKKKPSESFFKLKCSEIQTHYRYSTDDNFKCRFLLNVVHLNLTQVLFLKCIWAQVMIGSCNELTLWWQQTIIWTNDDQVNWRFSVSLGFYELRYCCYQIWCYIVVKIVHWFHFMTNYFYKMEASDYSIIHSKLASYTICMAL